MLALRVARLPGYSTLRVWTALVTALACWAGQPALAAEPAKPTVAVLYFDYDGGKDELVQLRKGFAQMLTTDLAEMSEVRVVERARLQELLDEMKLGASKKVDPASAAKLGKLLGAKFLVLGAYFEVMGALRFDARVVETETGRIVKSVGLHGKPDEVLDLEQRLAEKLKDGLEGSLTTAQNDSGQAPAKKSAPRKPAVKVSTAAVAAYGRAMEALDRKDKTAARKELQVAVATSPGFPMATADLARLAM